MVSIIQASTSFHFEQARELFTEYAKSLDIDLGFQNFDDELENIPAKYGTSAGGCLLLAVDHQETVGCVAIRRMDEKICEMKRLYVKPDWKGQGIGKRLALSIIEEAMICGYGFMRLDTLSTMKPAISLYESLEFYTIEPYIYNPIEGAMYLELDLLKRNLGY
ncbi:GNAT family N-acetyltransferase [Ammoniphilus sp. CFH 90114]|uniref:GNAT family N-acetyltransferase n=1 Tax=Ammoniphilus sp. CFH 90114 TaxID=2493665 RepID=UPI00100EF91B|nr:GNAT family N-acetyltransferase [Ammoniphilus sp. CFH 90114]RXT07050.1 GNAT family N-acetyltransferase [Ammoniphilus sp. CFH 90114]